MASTWDFIFKLQTNGTRTEYSFGAQIQEFIVLLGHSMRHDRFANVTLTHCQRLPEIASIGYRWTQPSPPDAVPNKTKLLLDWVIFIWHVWNKTERKLAVPTFLCHAMFTFYTRVLSLFFQGVVVIVCNPFGVFYYVCVCDTLSYTIGAHLVFKLRAIFAIFFFRFMWVSFLLFLMAKEYFSSPALCQNQLLLQCNMCNIRLHNGWFGVGLWEQFFITLKMSINHVLRGGIFCLIFLIPFLHLGHVDIGCFRRSCHPPYLRLESCGRRRTVQAKGNLRPTTHCPPAEACNCTALTNVATWQQRG